MGHEVLSEHLSSGIKNQPVLRLQKVEHNPGKQPNFNNLGLL